MAKAVNGTRVKGWVYGDELRPIAEIDGDGNVVSRFVYGSRLTVDLTRSVADNYGQFTLEDAERDLNRAHTLDAAFLPALEELAHFYDAVTPDSAKAVHFAQLYLQHVSKAVTEMREIAGAT